MDSRSQNPFECKDIKLALTEIRELHQKIDTLETDKVSISPISISDNHLS
jgi:hypothetical protein